jgi:hypothetical protein
MVFSVVGNILVGDAPSFFRSEVTVVTMKGSHSDPWKEERREGRRRKGDERINRIGKKKTCQNTEDHTLERRLMNDLECYVLGCNAM